jgi:N-acetylglutamate synthase-like GNAT family acetyltransferase
MTARGQRLFVRPIEAADSDAVRAFLAAHAGGAAVPETGLVGKLVGNLVAVLAMEVTPDAIRIDDLIVAPELRRKQIGRVMLAELADLAAKMERNWLVVERGDSREFLQRVGFVEAQDGRMVRRVR